MNELSREAAALLRAGRDAFRPDDGDRERVLASLTRELGGPPTGAQMPTTGAAVSFAARVWPIAGPSLITLGVVMAVVIWPRTATTSRPPAPPVPALSDAPEASPPVGPSSAPTPAPPASSPGRASVPAPGGGRGGTDPLRAEVRLLARAEQQLNAGLPGDALRTLAEHARSFPQGVLSEERLAAQIQASCALRRFPEGRAELRELMQKYPQSPHVELSRRCLQESGAAD